MAVIEATTAAFPTTTERRPVFVWLVAATFLPAIVVIVGASTGIGAPAKAMIALFGAAHVPTTFGLYADPDLRPFLRSHPWRCFGVPAALVVGAAIAAVVTPPTVVPYLIGVFVCWQLHHFTKQNLGMLAFWCRANGLPGSDAIERRLIVATGFAAMGGVAPYLPLYADARLPAPGMLHSLGGIAWTAVSVLMVGRAAVGRRLPLLAVALFFSPLWLLSGHVASAVLGFVVAHGAQYYLMVGHLSLSRRWLPAVLFGSAVVGYFVLAAPTSGALWGAVFGVTMAHFVVDAGLWRMREPERRAYITRRFGFL